LHLEYLDRALRRLACEPGFRPSGWDETEISRFRLVVQCARAAKVEGDLRALHVLRLQECPDHQPGPSSIRLSSRRQLLLTFKSDDAPVTAVLSVMSIEASSIEMENHDE
jgi:plasmid maintenance system killer protein